MTNKTASSKASSTEAEAPPELSTKATEPEPDLNGRFPGWIAKLAGLGPTIAAIDSERKARGLPGLASKDYRFVLGRPGGIPFSFPVTVIYKPESPKEENLGTFRIGR